MTKTPFIGQELNERLAYWKSYMLMYVVHYAKSCAVDSSTSLTSVNELNRYMWIYLFDEKEV